MNNPCVLATTGIGAGPTLMLAAVGIAAIVVAVVLLRRSAAARTRGIAMTLGVLAVVGALSLGGVSAPAQAASDDCAPSASASATPTESEASTPAPSTPPPYTPAPSTPAPTTPAPSTPAPTTSAPTPTPSLDADACIADRLGFEVPRELSTPTERIAIRGLSDAQWASLTEHEAQLAFDARLIYDNELTATYGSPPVTRVASFSVPYFTITATLFEFSDGELRPLDSEVVQATEDDVAAAYAAATAGSPEDADWSYTGQQVRLVISLSVGLTGCGTVERDVIVEPSVEPTVEPSPSGSPSQSPTVTVSPSPTIVVSQSPTASVSPSPSQTDD